MIPAFIGIVYASLQERGRDALQAEEQALLIAKLSSGEFSELASGAELLLGTLAELKEVRNRDTAATDELFGRLLKQYPIYTFVGAADARGDIYSSSLPPSGPINVADRAYFQSAIRSRVFAIGDFIIGRVTGKPAVTFAHAVVDLAGNVESVIFVGADLARLRELAPTVDLPPGTVLTIIDNAGTVLSRHPDAERLIGKAMPEAPIVREVLGRKGEGSVSEVGLDGVKRLNGFVPLRGMGGGPYVIVGIPEETAFAAANLGFRRNIIILFVSLGVAVGLTVAATGLVVVRPISRLAAITRRFAAGDFAVRTGLGDERSELGELARGFDYMGSEIARREAEQRQAEDEIKKLNLILSSRAVELEAANKELEAFSFSVSHDLRAPLRLLDGFSQAVMEDYADKLDAQGREYLQRIRSASQSMGRMVDDFLNLARITRAELVLEKVNLSDLASDVVNELKSVQPERKVEFIITPGLEGYGDRRLLRLAFGNLLGNALKFTSKRADAKIEFGVRDIKGETAYFVRDNGVGFDMTSAHKLFKPFQRLHDTGEFPGEGIGLASVYRIINRFGGKVWAEGEKDKGATFYFTLRRDEG